MEQLRISAKDLGQLGLPGFCPRCFWVRRHAPKGLPFQIFPGIFSSIDAYTKRVVHQYFDAHGHAPEWLAPLGQLTGYREPPHFTTFSVAHEATGMLLTGALDAIFERADATLVLADYKTAKFSATQDKLFPMYAIQLNAYAYIAEALGWEPVSTLALIYTEPETEAQHADPRQSARPSGFAMGFAARILPVKLDVEQIDALLASARDLVMLEAPPPGRPGCQDCTKLSGLLKVSGA